MELTNYKKPTFFCVLFLVSTTSIMWIKKSDIIANKVVILSSSFNLRYVFLLPFTAAFWQKLGVQPVVVLIGEEHVYISHLQAKATVKLLKEMNISVYYFQNKKLSSTSLSQIIRLFAAVLSLPNETISDETIFITSDADLAVFNLSNHIPDIKHGKTIHLYNTNCCEPVNVPPVRGNYAVKMYPMGTIGATKATWEKVMGFKKERYNADEIEEYVLIEFGTNFFKPTDDTNPELLGSPIWYADQSLFSYKFDEWIKTTSNKRTMSEFTSAPRRIDRIQWPTAKNFSQLILKNFDDAHLPVAAYSEEEWGNFTYFIQFAYNNDYEIEKRFKNYRKCFCQPSIC